MEGKDSERKKEKDIAVLTFGIFLSNQLKDSSPATVDLVVTDYSRSRDEAIRLSKLAGCR